MKSAVTVRTIAETAGVSAMTVSRALRGEPNVDPVTAQRIREISAKLGYERNLLVSTVMSSVRGTKQPLCSHVIAFLTVDSASFPVQQRRASYLYLQGAKERAAECGFEVEEFTIRPTQADSRKISRILHARNIRGLLVGPLCRSVGHLSLDWKEFSSSAISINLVKPDLNRCGIDLVQSVNLALRNLRRLGYKRIGYAVPPFHVSLSHHRSRALYLDYQYELPPEQTVSLLKDWSSTGLAAWLEKEKPDVLLGHGDEVLAWLNELGVKMPLELGYVDINMCGGDTAPFAGVVFDFGTIGATAVNMVISDLLRNIHGVPLHPVHCYIQGIWRDGPTIRPQPRELTFVPDHKNRNGGKNSRLAQKIYAETDAPDPTHPLAKKKHISQWLPLVFRKMATHSYRNRKEITDWESGLGLPLNPGRQEINGVPFQLIDEKNNGGKGVVLLQNNSHLTLPVGSNCESVYFLIAAGFISAHTTIAQIIYTWADGSEEAHPLISYYQHPPTADLEERWIAEAGVQDWWPSFPHFYNQSARAFKVAGDDPNPVEWRYLYTLEWINPRPETNLNRITFQHMPNCDAKLAVFAATILLPK